MYEFSRRAFLKGLGKVTAALGMGFSLGAGCAKEETAMQVEAEPERRVMTWEERYERAQRNTQGIKKIIGLSCGSEKGNCETLLNAAAIGASEFGIETEIIQAAT